MTESAARRYVVGAYAASPAHQNWNPEEEELYFRGLTELRSVAAFELPWLGSLHPHDDEWLLAGLPEPIDAVITDIPFIMQRLAENANFGLASRDDAGRRAALSAVARVRDDAARLNDRKGRRVVRAVELHSAPRRERGTTDALAASLAEIASWDWQGAELLIEHCDAQVDGQDPEKGFLGLDEEIRAIRTADAGIGMSMNWGRSAIELRSADRVADQVADAAGSGLLRGLMLSGASDRASMLGRAWLDAHHPFRRSERHPFGEPASLLTDENAGAAIEAAGAGVWLGAKVGWTGAGGSVSDRVRMIGQALDVIAEHDTADATPASVATS